MVCDVTRALVASRSWFYTDLFTLYARLRQLFPGLDLTSDVIALNPVADVS